MCLAFQTKEHLHPMPTQTQYSDAKNSANLDYNKCELIIINIPPFAKRIYNKLRRLP